MTKHALLSASSSHRWLACPPSARFCENYEDKSSDYAAEGTDAHTLCEYKLRRALGEAAKNPTPNFEYYGSEMENCANEYAEYVMELYEEIKKICSAPVVLIEQRLDYSRFVESGFGTGDCVIVGDGTLYVVDYKHGKGVEVSAIENPQMMCYALGALELFDSLYDIETVTMTIFQPRRENVSVFTMQKADLYSWAETVLAPTAKLAFAGEGEFCAGEHCQFCKANAECRKRAEYNLEFAQYDFRPDPTLEYDEIAVILAKADELAAWAEDIKEYALQQAISGKEWPGWKLVEGRSNHKYTNETAVAETVMKAGLDPYEHKLLVITATEKRHHMSMIISEILLL